MIIGHGDIASALADRPDRIFFASGVSNSGETRESEFQRERNLMMMQPWSGHMVYFSSLSVFYSDTAYAQHKRRMESLVKLCSRWTILRIGNITWGNNPHTIINYLRHRAANGEVLDIQNAERYLIDKDEFLYWVNMIPEWSCELSITGRRMTVQQIVDEYVNGKQHEIQKRASSVEQGQADEVQIWPSPAIGNGDARRGKSQAAPS